MQDNWRTFGRPPRYTRSNKYLSPTPNPTQLNPKKQSSLTNPSSRCSLNSIDMKRWFIFNSEPKKKTVPNLWLLKPGVPGLEQFLHHHQHMLLCSWRHFGRVHVYDLRWSFAPRIESRSASVTVGIECICAEEDKGGLIGRGTGKDCWWYAEEKNGSIDIGVAAISKEPFWLIKV